MGEEIIEGVYFYSLKPIVTTGGKVMHAIKGLDENLPAFGECYFSTAESYKPKAWKKHSVMICNLFVPKGAVRFIFFDDRDNSKDKGEIKEFTLSESNYGRLVINPGIWFGFCGVAPEESIVMNVGNILHDPQESFRMEPDSDEIPFKW